MKDLEKTDFSDFSMLELFRMEVDTQLDILNKGLLALEKNNYSSEWINPLMRAAHSIKGAARMVNVDAVVRIAHVIEDCFVALQNKNIVFTKNDIDSLLSGIDLIHQISMASDEKVVTWGADNIEELIGMEVLLKTVYTPNSGNDFSRNEQYVTEKWSGDIDNKTACEFNESSFIHAGNDTVENEGLSLDQVLAQVENKDAHSDVGELADESNSLTIDQVPHTSTAIRISIDRLDKIYSLAGKSLVESHQLNVLMPEFWQIKHKHQMIISQLNRLQENLTKQTGGEAAKESVKAILSSSNELRHQFSDVMAKLDAIDRRSSSITDLLHREIMSSRMRPISEILNGLPRMVRDLGRSLNKDVRIQISGLSTLVDRHVLEKIDVPIKHLVQNAVDHGVESADERSQAGKPKLATITLDVSISAGMLFVVVEDDGKGVDFARLKEKILDKKLAEEYELHTLDDIALLDFLFYPGFSTRDVVDQISGRGIGLDVVKDAVMTLNGSVQASSIPHSSTRFQMILPLNVSVLRVLLVMIGGQSYAFPLSAVDQTVYIDKNKIKTRSEGSFVFLDGEEIQLMHANAIFDCRLPDILPPHLVVLVLKSEEKKYAIVVDKSDGEQEVSIQKLSSDFRKIQIISSAAILNNGLLTLIIDTEEYTQVIDALLLKKSHQRITNELIQEQCKVIKVLVVDDSITVREMERKLLIKLHYSVSVAGDGVEALNKLDNEVFDLIVTDIDMPNMDGIRLINAIRFRDSIANIPILIVSNREKFFIEQSVVLDDKTRFYEKDVFTPKGFLSVVKQLEKVADTVF